MTVADTASTTAAEWVRKKPPEFRFEKPDLEKMLHQQKR